MALRTRYSGLDMIRMAKFAKDNPDLKPIPLIKAYCEQYPEITIEQKLKNIRNWLDDSRVMAVAEGSDECATLPIQRVSKSVVCDYCNNTGWDSYPNHDTTLRPCPECQP